MHCHPLLSVHPRVWITNLIMLRLCLKCIDTCDAVAPVSGFTPTAAATQCQPMRFIASQVFSKASQHRFGTTSHDSGQPLAASPRPSLAVSEASEASSDRTSADGLQCLPSRTHSAELPSARRKSVQVTHGLRSAEAVKPSCMRRPVASTGVTRTDESMSVMTALLADQMSRQVLLTLMIEWASSRAGHLEADAKIAIGAGRRSLLSASPELERACAVHPAHNVHY